MDILSLVGTMDRIGFSLARLLLGILWQSSILLVAVGVLALFLRNRPAAKRCNLWFIAVILSPLLPLITIAAAHLGAPRAPIAMLPAYIAPAVIAPTPVAPAHAPSTEHNITPAPSPEAAAATRAAQPAPTVSVAQPAPLPHKSLFDQAQTHAWAIMFIAYGVIMASLLLWIVIGRARIRSWIHSATVETSDRLLTAFTQAKKSLQIRRAFLVMSSDKVPAPMSYGILHPVVLLPKDLAGSLSDEELNALAAHELSHIKRYDSAVLMLVALARAALFFHPLIWIAGKQISILSEQAADDAALESSCQPVPYAKLLTRLAEELPPRRTSTEFATGIFFTKGAFLMRVEAILSDRTQVRRLSRMAAIGVAAIVLLFVGIALVLPLGERAVADETTATKAGTAEKPIQPSTPHVKDMQQQPTRPAVFVSTCPDILSVLIQAVPAEAAKSAASDQEQIRGLASLLKELPDEYDKQVKTGWGISDALAASAKLSTSAAIRISETSTTEFFKGQANYRSFEITPLAVIGTYYADLKIAAYDAKKNVIRESVVRAILDRPFALNNMPGNDDFEYCFTAKLPPSVTVKSKIIDFRIDQQLPLGLKVDVFDGIWVKFESRDKGVLATLHTGITSAPKRTGKVKVQVVGKQATVLAEGWKEFENSGWVLGVPGLGTEDLEVMIPISASEAGRKAIDVAVTLESREAAAETPTQALQKPAAAGQTRTRKFARFVVGPDGMTFEGQKTTLDELQGLMEKVPDRKNTVFEMAISDENMNAADLRQEQGRAMQLAGQLGFEYVSDIGVQAAGSKGSAPQEVEIPPVAKQVILPANSAAAGEAQGQVTLSYVAEETETKRSLGASGHAVEFTRPEKAKFVETVEIYASRYGLPQPPQEDFHLYLLDDKFQPLADVPYHYSMIQRTEGMKWYTLRTPSVEVPSKFYVALAFNPDQRKGIYLGLDTNVKESHSWTGLPEEGFEKWTEPGDWMVRVTLAEQPSGAEGTMKLSDVKQVTKSQPFADASEWKYDTGASGGQQSYGGGGPAIIFDKKDFAKDADISKLKLKGLRLYGSRYGSGYPPATTPLVIMFLDAQGKTIREAQLNYSPFLYKARWVDLPFKEPIDLKSVASADGKITIAINPAAHQTRGIYFHYNKTDKGHSDMWSSKSGLKDLNDREWMIRAMVSGTK